MQKAFSWECEVFSQGGMLKFLWSYWDPLGDAGESSRDKPHTVSTQDVLLWLVQELHILLAFGRWDIVFYARFDW